MAWTHLSGRLGKVLFPLAGALAIGAVLYFGGTAFQSIGLAALSSSWQILGYLFGFCEIVFLGMLVQRLFQYVVLEGVVAPALGTPVPRLLTQLSAVVIYLVAAAAIAGIVFGQDLTVLWAASGIAGFVFGMALRELILDLFTGLAINLDRPIRIGDNVLLHRAGDGVIEGKVLEISWRTTRIQDLFRNVVVIPNSRIAQATITNYSMPEPFFRVPIPIVLAPEVPSERAIRILEAAATEGSAGFVPKGAPAPIVWLQSVTPAGVEYIVNFFPTLETRIRGRGVVLQQILRHLALAGLKPAWTRVEQAATEGTDRPQEHHPSTGHRVLLLETTDLFRDLGREELALLAAAAPLRRAAPGTVLIQAGETATSLYLLLEGLAAVEGGRAAPAAGTPIAAIGPGTVIGAYPMLIGEAHPATVRTRTECLACEVDHALLRRLFERRPEAAAWLSRRAAAQQLRERNAGRPHAAIPVAEADLAAEILGNLRRHFADVRLP